LWIGYLVLYAVVGVSTIGYLPTFAFPTGDEGTYLNYARQPWTNLGEYFVGYPPKETINPYNFRLLLAPFSLLFALFGWTWQGARVIVLAYGLGILGFVFAIVSRLTRPAYGVLAGVLLSLSPAFVMATHRAQPEPLFSLLILGCVAILLRRNVDPKPLDLMFVGLLASCCLWVHYNGVLVWLVFLPVIAAFELGRGLPRKLASYLGGVSLFAAIYIPLNLLPARHTIATYGFMPVTFSSSNSFPILDPSIWWAAIRVRFQFYLSCLGDKTYLESTAWLLTLFFVLPVFLVLVVRPRRGVLLLGATVVMFSLLLLLVLPKARSEYLFYVYPLLFVLAAIGLARLSSNRYVRFAMLMGVLVIAGDFLASDWQSLRIWRARAESNSALGETLDEIIRQLDLPREETIVMGCQEFEAFAPNTRFRTFHSLIATSDFALTLDLQNPDVVVLNPRSYLQMLACMISRPTRARTIPDGQQSKRRAVEVLAAAGILTRSPSGVRIDRTRFRVWIHDCLIQTGYVRAENQELTFNDKPVEIYVARQR